MRQKSSPKTARATDGGGHTTRRVRASGVSSSILVNVVAGISTLATALVVFPIYASALGTQTYSRILLVTAICFVALTIDLGYSQIVTRQAAGLQTPFTDNQHVRDARARLRWAGLLPATIVFCGALVVDVQAVGGIEAVFAAAVFGGLIPISWRSSQSMYEGSLSFVLPRGLLMASNVLRLGCALSIDAIPGHLAVAVVIVAEVSGMWLPALGCTIVRAVRHTHRLEPGSSARQTGREWRALVTYGRGMCVSVTLETILVYCDVLTVGVVLSPAAVVLFAASSRVIQMYRQLIGWVTAPTANRLMTIDHAAGAPGVTEVWRRTHPSSVLFFSGVAAASCLIGVLFVPVLLPVADDHEVAQAQLVVVILMASVVVGSAHQFSILVMNALRRPMVFVGPQIMWTVSKICAGGLLGHLYGLIGSAIGIFAATLVIEVIYLRRIASGLGIAPSEILMRCGLAASLGAGTVIAAGLLLIAHPVIGSVVLTALAVTGMSAALRIRTAIALPSDPAVGVS